MIKRFYIYEEGEWGKRRIWERYEWQNWQNSKVGPKEKEVLERIPSLGLSTRWGNHAIHQNKRLWEELTFPNLLTAKSLFYPFQSLYLILCSVPWEFLPVVSFRQTIILLTRLQQTETCFGIWIWNCQINSCYVWWLGQRRLD